MKSIFAAFLYVYLAVPSFGALTVQFTAYPNLHNLSALPSPLPPSRPIRMPELSTINSMVQTMASASA